MDRRSFLKSISSLSLGIPAIASISQAKGVTRDNLEDSTCQYTVHEEAQNHSLPLNFSGRIVSGPYSDNTPLTVEFTVTNVGEEPYRIGDIYDLAFHGEYDTTQNFVIAPDTISSLYHDEVGNGVWRANSLILTDGLYITRVIEPGQTIRQKGQVLFTPDASMEWPNSIEFDPVTLRVMPPSQNSANEQMIKWNFSLEPMVCSIDQIFAPEFLPGHPLDQSRII